MSEKAKSPFYPGQPVPVELFAGRMKEIDHVLKRGIGQVAAGKPVAMYIEGEYGIGKSSLAGFLQWYGRENAHLHSVYAPIGAAKSIEDVGQAILEASIRSGALNPTRSEKVRDWLGKYVGDQSLFGVTLHMEALRHDAPDLLKGILPFLAEMRERMGEGIRGIFLVLDEIDGIAGNPHFAHFVKGVVDTNAMSPSPVPLLLMLCGVQECRREMIRQHQPVDRIFDVVQIEPMRDDEMKDFFRRAFAQADMKIEEAALGVMCHFSAGFPKMMHLIGDAAYWSDKDGVVSQDDALDAVFEAPEEVGRKYVEQQLYRALHSADYHTILAKLGRRGGATSMHFQKKEVEKELTDREKRKFNNFLQKMKDLKVLRSGDVRGEYVFNHRMVRLYLWLEAHRKDRLPTTP